MRYFLFLVLKFTKIKKNYIPIEKEFYGSALLSWRFLEAVCASKHESFLLLEVVILV